MPARRAHTSTSRPHRLLAASLLLGGFGASVPGCGGGGGPAAPLTVSVEAPADPDSVTLVTPDGPGQNLTFARDGDQIAIDVPALRYYDVLVLDGI